MDEQRHMSTPTLVSLLVCDQIIDDRLTNKKSAIGLFNAILVAKFPVAIQQVVVMAAVTEIQGQVELELRLVRDTDNTVVMSTKQEVKAPGPLATVDLVFALRGIRIPGPGQYAFEILCQDALLGRRRFHVHTQENQRGVDTTYGGPPMGEGPHDSQ